MSVPAHIAQTQQETQPATTQPASSLLFDSMMIVFSCWFMGGLFLDGWAHTHIPRLETFFTPWHAVLYSGYLSVALFLVISLYRNHVRGYAWSRALPSGYELSLLGAGIFAVSGVADMIWHILFGIEQNVEALLSPTHLGLATGLILCMSGPLRAAWRRPESMTRGWKALLPMLFSVAFIFSVFTFFTEYAHPFVRLTASSINPAAFPGSQVNVSLGLVSILFQAALLASVVLLVVRRFTLPFGAFTLIFTLNITLLSILGNHYNLIPAAALGGLGADLLYWQLKPSMQRPDMLRLFAFAVPALFYLCYFLNLEIIRGIQWSIHLWLGSVFMAGIIGLLLSFLVVPMQGAAKKEE
ncbi:MAG: hypothetical protein ACRDIV_05825 [Ktedonobacteraceae bacterium]